MSIPEMNGLVPAGKRKRTLLVAGAGLLVALTAGVYLYQALERLWEAIDRSH